MHTSTMQHTRHLLSTRSCSLRALRRLRRRKSCLGCCSIPGTYMPTYYAGSRYILRIRDNRKQHKLCHGIPVLCSIVGPYIPKYLTIYCIYVIIESSTNHVYEYTRTMQHSRPLYIVCAACYHYYAGMQYMHSTTMHTCIRVLCIHAY